MMEIRTMFPSVGLPMKRHEEYSEAIKILHVMFGVLVMWMYTFVKTYLFYT